jgi:hypothetical protein
VLLFLEDRCFTTVESAMDEDELLRLDEVEEMVVLLSHSTLVLLAMFEEMVEMVELVGELCFLRGYRPIVLPLLLLFGVFVVAREDEWPLLLLLLLPTLPVADEDETDEEVEEEIDDERSEKNDETLRLRPGPWAAVGSGGGGGGSGGTGGTFIELGEGLLLLM